MREFERHSFFAAVLDAMREPGCPLCRMLAAASHHYLDGILYEAVNTEEFRARFRAARGFCPRHSREVAGFESALGATILLREVLGDALDRWRLAAAKGRAIKPPRAKCPACVTEDALVRNFLDTTFGHIGDARLLDAWRASDGLCVAHFEALLAEAPAKTRVALVEIEAAKVERLLKRLDEFSRKCDYRFAHEPKGDEGRAWLDAISKSAGGVPDA